jgi:hypothetical protein
MRDEERGVKLSADLKASKTITKQAALTWPLPADRRLDQLADLANEAAGASTRRNELAAAIIAATEADGDALLGLILRWRRARVAEVVLEAPDEQNVIHLPRFGPGRRRTNQ